MIKKTEPMVRKGPAKALKAKGGKASKKMPSAVSGVRNVRGY